MYGMLNSIRTSLKFSQTVAKVSIYAISDVDVSIKVYDCSRASCTIRTRVSKSFSPMALELAI